MVKPKLFLDMDNVLVDTLTVLNDLDMTDQVVKKPDQVPGIFLNLEPMPGAVAAVNELANHFELYILSTAPWLNASAWQDKLIWLQRYFGDGPDNPFYKRVVMAHDKSLARGVGGILVDDRPYHGASAWDDAAADSMWVQFGHAAGRLTWTADLVGILTQVADAIQTGATLRETVEEVFSAAGLTPHGAVDTFEKAAWE